MKKTQFIFLWFICLSIQPQTLQAQSKTQSFDSMIQIGMEDWKIPGLITAVYHKDTLVFSKVYGLKNLTTNEPVKRNTVFNLGSSTKSIICMALGILVDQGKLTWEDKVKDHLPGFHLSDPYVTEDARVKDLLIHNLGIASADLLAILDSVSTSETLRRFSFAKKIHPLRGAFEYNNLMYVIAGELIGTVSGQHWSSFLNDKIFDRLEMHQTFTKAVDILPYGNYATPYFYYEDKGFLEHPLTLDDQVGATGNIWSCITDMEHYLEMLVNKGKYKDRVILDPETFEFLFKPHTLESIPEIEYIYSAVKPTWRTYGLGWFQHDYRGEKLDFHPGNIDGLNAIVGVMNSKDISVFVMANRDWAELRHAMLYKAIDLWIYDDDSRDWHKEIYDADMVYIKEMEVYWKTIRDSRIMNTAPTVPLKDYEGRYTHPMYGEAIVRVNDTGLEIEFNKFIRFETEHWQYDSFLGSPVGQKFDEKKLFDFQAGRDGKINSFKVYGESFIKE